jgi:hypothetical protein
MDDQPDERQGRRPNHMDQLQRFVYWPSPTERRIRHRSKNLLRYQPTKVVVSLLLSLQRYHLTKSEFDYYVVLAEEYGDYVIYYGL